uniref:Ovule protein n=1 Tax=Romanomermis culicivorax TaxID=13658 RepID=A0A915KHA0_ROMCU
MPTKSFDTLNKYIKKIFLRSQECLSRTEIFRISQPCNDTDSSSSTYPLTKKITGLQCQSYQFALTEITDLVDV